MAQNTTELAKSTPLGKLGKALKSREKSFAQVLGKRVPISVFLNAMVATYNKLPGLHECTPDSQLAAWNSAAVLAQIPGRDVYWLPFRNGKTGKKEVVVVTDYRDIIKKVMDYGRMDDIYARPVYKDDEFEVIEGTNPQIVHKPNYASENRRDEDLKAFYMVAFPKGAGRPHFEVMTNKEVKRIQRLSKAGDKPDGPWINHYVEMGKKTVLKRGTKTMPQNLFPQEFMDALRREDKVEFDRPKVVEATIIDDGGNLSLDNMTPGDPSTVPEHDKRPTTPPANKMSVRPPASAQQEDAAVDAALLKDDLREVLSGLSPAVSDKIMEDCGIANLDSCTDPVRLEKALETARFWAENGKGPARK